jgi:hypothetical protein
MSPVCERASDFHRRVTTIDLTEKAKLAEPAWQRLLREPGLEFFCPCALRVEPFRDPHGRGHNVKARWGEERLHAEDCPVVHGEMGLQAIEHGEVIYTAGMFQPRSAGWLATQLSNGSSKDGRFWYGDFAHFMNRTFAEASLSAFETVNRNHTGPLVNPGHESVSSRIAESLHEPLLTDGTSPVEAARRAGVTINWGVCGDLLVHRLHGMRYHATDEWLQVGDLWGPMGRVTAPPRFRIPLLVARDCRGKVWQHDRIIQPPYLFFLTADTENVVQQLSIIPVAQHGRNVPWHSKESDPEGEMIRRVRSEVPSVGLVKLAVRTDMSLLNRFWPHRMDHLGRLPGRPDLIALGRHGTTIYQLEGSRDRIYREGVQRSLRELRDFLQDPRVLIRAITLGELRSGAPRFIEELKSIAG